MMDECNCWFRSNVKASDKNQLPVYHFPCLIFARVTNIHLYFSLFFSAQKQ